MIIDRFTDWSLDHNLETVGIGLLIWLGPVAVTLTIGWWPFAVGYGVSASFGCIRLIVQSLIFWWADR